MATKLASLQVAYGDEDDKPQAGFDTGWVFEGREYNDPTFNINGQQVKQPEGSYTSDRLTDYAVEWLEATEKDKPFFSLPIP